MISTHDVLRDRLLAKAGLKESPPTLLDRGYDYDKLRRTQWSSEFEELMRARLIMGAFRYGLLEDQIGQMKFDNPKSIQKRIQKFIEDGNKEHLVDIANLCLVEFVTNTEAEFKAIDDGEHVPLK